VWERLYIIGFLMGGLLYGGILARLVGILSSIGPRNKDIERRKQEITAYLNKRKVLPHDLRYIAKVRESDQMRWFMPVIGAINYRPSLGLIIQ